MKNYSTTRQQITRGILRIGYMTALGMALTFALPSAAHAQIITPPPVPPGLEVDAPNEAFLRAAARTSARRSPRCWRSRPSTTT